MQVLMSLLISFTCTTQGSERQRKTGATQERLTEAISINQSLSALGDVTSALVEGQAPILYRNSKLTRLLATGCSGREFQKPSW